MNVLAASTAAGNAELVGFVLLAPVAVLAALGMVFSRNTIYAALALVVNFFCLAGMYVFLQAQFIAAVQVIVYAGAIMILFLFVLMLLGVRRDTQLSSRIRIQGTVAFVFGAVLFAGVAAGVAATGLPNDVAGLTAANEGGNVQAVGRLLFTRYPLAFEATGVLLMVAGVGALVLARRGGPEPDEDTDARATSRPEELPGDGTATPEAEEEKPAVAATTEREPEVAASGGARNKAERGPA